MQSWALPICANPLRDRADLEKSLDALIEPLLSRFVRGNAGLHVGNTSAHYDEVATLLEGESRLLWGLAPYAAGRSGMAEHCEAAIAKCVEGLKNGPDPYSSFYWGIGGDRDQRYVEMAAIAFSLMIAPETFWEPLSPPQKKALADWLGTINSVELPPTNWVFFRVLVNLALRRRGCNFSAVRLHDGLDAIDALYRREGWYIDETNYDFYNPFAFHFYGLIYSRLEGQEDPARAARYRERAGEFAAQFLPWFSDDGSCIPFGRSLCYRFAVSSFFAACAFAGLEVLPFGVMKGIVLRNLRWWFGKPIFDHEGLLTIGYAYPNLIMAEQYNSPGSPYWALKAYLPLALPENHPFWAATEESLPPQRSVSHNAVPHLLICSAQQEGARHKYLLNGGQYPCWESVQSAAKYAKFAYSGQFGFCVSHGAFGLSKTGCDSSLVLSEGDGYWRERRQSKCRYSCAEYAFSVWSPWPDVHIGTWLIPCGFWHVRVHAIESGRALETAEGGFSLPDNNGQRGPERPVFVASAGTDRLFAAFPWACGGIVDLAGGRTAELHKPEPNLNILYPKVLVPMLFGTIGAGLSLLACAVVAAQADECADTQRLWEEIPEFFIDLSAERFDVKYRGKDTCIDMRSQGGCDDSI